MRNTEKYPARLQAGSIFEPLLILLGLAVILVFFILPGAGVMGPAVNVRSVTGISVSGPVTGSSAGGASSGSGTTLAPALIATSAYAHAISIDTGDASYATDPFEEYITIQNEGSAPVNISGWQLKNNTASRTYETSGNLLHYASADVTIPQAVGYISPIGQSPLQNVVLKPGEQAVITTGSTGVVTPYKITSFKENECSGYLEALPQYNFTPSLSYMCVPPSQEPGVSGFDSACRNLISSIGICQTPVYGQTDRTSNDNCSNCVNGRPAPSQRCLDFIKAHFSYQGCIDYHASDPKFYGNTWRVFLGQKWELWGAEDEVISLFDQFGKLVTSRSY